MPRTFIIKKSHYSTDRILVISEEQAPSAQAITENVAKSLIAAGERFEFECEGEPDEVAATDTF